jgi:hypothetical protein
MMLQPIFAQPVIQAAKNVKDLAKTVKSALQALLESVLEWLMENKLMVADVHLDLV